MVLIPQALPVLLVLLLQLHDDFVHLLLVLLIVLKGLLYLESLSILAILHAEKSRHHRVRACANIVQLSFNVLLVLVASTRLLDLSHCLLHSVVLHLEVIALDVVENGRAALMMKAVSALYQQALTLLQPPLQRAALPPVPLAPPPFLALCRPPTSTSAFALALAAVVQQATSVALTAFDAISSFRQAQVLLR